MIASLGWWKLGIPFTVEHPSGAAARTGSIPLVDAAEFVTRYRHGGLNIETMLALQPKCPVALFHIIGEATNNWELGWYRGLIKPVPKWGWAFSIGNDSIGNDSIGNDSIGNDSISDEEQESIVMLGTGAKHPVILRLGIDKNNSI